ncbi:MAG: pilus assembly protein [Propionibacteriaceae bacterium]|jgi:Flp pilus assembly protein TadG|nr:pilus assembly protein [Propionibacteriaceae bacterium]
MRTTVERVRDERGAVVSVWTTVIATIMVLVLGIAVDLGGLVHAKQSAGDAAAQAARRAGQQLSTGTLLDTGRLEVRTRQARAAAVDYLQAVGMTGTATVENGTTLIVTAHATYRPLFLSSIGVGPLEVTGSSSVRVVRVENGTER